MNQGRLVFTQITDRIYRADLQRCVSKYPMPRRSRSFSARDHLLAMIFAQLTFRESLRDIEACLDRARSLRFGMGIRGRVTRTNLAYANENRDWRIFAELSQILIRRARRLYQGEPSELDLDEMLYALDSTVIDLCLAIFPWAKFRSAKAAVKVHTLMEVKGSIPCFIAITEGSVHDVNVLDELPIEPGSIYVMDRGYVDFARLFRIASACAFFVTRAKSNLRFYVSESRRVDKSTGLICDQTIRLNSAKGKKNYPSVLRRIVYRDPETNKRLVFITNHFQLPALTIALIYKSRWRIELFFKWIKQNLRIRTFFGTSENAVKLQIWTAISTYLLVAILKKELAIPENLNRILQILSVHVFQKEPLDQLFTESYTTNGRDEIPNQLLFNWF